MIFKSATNDVVCPVGRNLLVRFKEGKESSASVTPKVQARKSDFKDAETNVYVCINSRYRTYLALSLLFFYRLLARFYRQ